MPLVLMIKRSKYGIPSLVNVDEPYKDTQGILHLKSHRRLIYNRSVYSVCKVEPGVIASGSDDNKIKIWNIDTGECRRTLEGHTKYITLKISWKANI